MSKINFSWVLEGRLAGHAAPKCTADILWLKSEGIQALIRMEEENKSTITNSAVIDAGLSDLHLPVKDFTAPTLEQCNQMVASIDEYLKQGKPVGVSCGAGMGRTGVILACFLVHTGLSAKEAIKQVRRMRPASIETAAQENAVTAFMDNLEIQKKWPKTVDEAVNRILLMISVEDKHIIKNCQSENDMSVSHAGLGKWVRNNFGLWRGNEALIKNCGGHKRPDDNSAMILLALWQKLHKKSLLT